MEIVRYVPSFDRSNFDWGKVGLNDWLRTQATQRQKSNNMRMFLAVEDDQIVGYYPSSTYRLGLDEADGVRRRENVSTPFAPCSWPAWPSIARPRVEGSELRFSSTPCPSSRVPPRARDSRWSSPTRSTRTP